ncbi:histidine phosphatase family protein [Methylobacterium aquaticum]|nr:histidine phosphatase family protein [Methylobacterium aquaticum]
MRVLLVTHPEVTIDPAVPVPDWGLSARGRERMAAFCARPEAASIGHVFVSSERKARDGADMLHERHGCPVTIDPRLGENDRSATGYVAPPRFWEIVDRFFAEPETSVLGWERAVDAQARIKAAVRDCIAAHGDRVGDVCIVSHGGVGTLLLCDLLGAPISRDRDQPVAGGGCFFAFDGSAWVLEHGWRDIVPSASDR